MTLLHIVRPGEWDSAAVEPGPEGFVHLSGPEQVHTPAALFYGSATDLSLLVVDESRLTDEVRVESGFPHLYGPLPAAAVVDVVPYDSRVAWVPTDPDDEPARSLLVDDEAELADLYDGVAGSPQPRDELRSPGGAFVVGWQDGLPVACGGFRRHDEVRCELRRLYVVPGARRQGLGRGLVAALETTAARRGYGTALLDTGPHQAGAEALYRSVGYVDTAPYRESAQATFWGTKPLR